MSKYSYTSRANIEGYVGETFPMIDDTTFDTYISQAEFQVNNICGYNGATTLSGMHTEAVSMEKVEGKIDVYGNLVVDVMHPPVHFDQFNNPMVSLLRFSLGGVRIDLNLDDGSTAYQLGSFLEVSESRRKILYPNMYFLPALSMVTPTAKINLYDLHDVKFFVTSSYIGGYDTIPPDVVLATNILAADIVHHRHNPDFLTRIQQGSYSADWSSDSEIMTKSTKILQPYIRYTW
jgi:hypothetical protein